jgi:D-glycero-beta-D-manno-heptose-7-phosphate kinase
MPQKSLKWLEKFSDCRLAVVGDAMVDRFLWGSVSRISPEAPVPIVKLERETVKLGGAANVAANIRSLGSDVELITVVGNDNGADTLSVLLNEKQIRNSGVFRIKSRRTTLKTRIIAHSQQVVRTDIEDDHCIDDDISSQMLERLRSLGPFDGIVLSDYGKGVLTKDFLQSIIGYAKETNAIIVADPKKGDFSQYKGVTSLTPNQLEASGACSINISDPQSLSHAGTLLRERTNSEAVLITRGEHGMALFEKDGAEHHLPTEATDVYDVTGAGDTVIAAFTTALSAGADFLTSANIANHAAGLAVRELGTVAITVNSLKESINR